MGDVPNPDESTELAPTVMDYPSDSALAYSDEMPVADEHRTGWRKVSVIAGAILVVAAIAAAGVVLVGKRDAPPLAALPATPAPVVE